MPEAKPLPDDAVLVRTTAVFDEESVPAGLLRAHRVADGVWGRLVVHRGTLDFLFEDEPEAPITLAAGDSVVIPPAVPHRVVLTGSTAFAVEFHRVGS
ncbi:MAG: DUF1971 domain-containing protein [Acidimicrobiales bacterium]